MLYQPIPMGEIWEDGMIAVPKKIATNYLKLASEYQLKALLIIFSKSGGCPRRWRRPAPQISARSAFRGS